jgi:N-acetylmuramic acid 6-phosphate (MurNAc-6-P) etherase
MVGVRPTNRKLAARACAIISELAATDIETAARALRAGGNDSRVAITMLRTGADRKRAETLLDRHGGSLRELLQSRQPR